MKFLAQWLGLEPPGGRVGFRVVREFVMVGGKDAAIALVLDSITLILGANIDVRDDERGHFETSFGLVEQRERVSFEMRKTEGGAIVICVEASFPAVRHAPKESQAVAAVSAYFLSRGAQAL